MRIMLLLVIACLAGCGQQKLYESSFLSFGTIIEISLYAENLRQARQAFDVAEAEFSSMHNSLHAWNPGPLTELNQHISSGRTSKPEQTLLAVIRQARTLSIQSRNLFNPAIGHLISAWGFHQDTPEKTPSPPDESTIDTLLAAKPIMENLNIHEAGISSSNSAVKLDFGGFAKGYGLGIIADKLKASGIDDFILNAGGDLITHGQHPDRPWRIAIRDPDGNHAIAGLQAGAGEAIFTSGDYERFYISEGKRRHHIIDPRSGYSAENTRAVTVIHTDPARADAAATALFIAGPELWPEIAAEMGISYVILLDSQHVIHMTELMAERIQINNAADYEIRVISATSSQK